MRGGEVFPDQLLISPGIPAPRKRLDVVRRRRQAREIQAEAADERPTIGLRRRGEPGVIERLEDEGIDGVGRGGRHGGDGRTLGCDESPVRLIFGAFRDPAFQDLLLRPGQAVVGLGRRHLLFRVVAENPANEFAGLGLARLERADREGNVALIQSQLGLALILIRAVAPKTILRKNRPDLAVEAQPFRGAARGRPAAESGERDQQAGQRSPPAHKK